MTQPTTERDRIKERVAKLLNLTLDKGASENEAMMAAEKAAELMAFYDIEASELSVRSTRAIKQTVSARKYGKMIIAAPVAHLRGEPATTHRRRRQPKRRIGYSRAAWKAMWSATKLEMKK